MREAADRGAPAVRAYPQHWGMAPGDAAPRRGSPTPARRPGWRSLLTVRFEDVRQRHPLDGAPDLHGGARARLGRSARAHGASSS